MIADEAARSETNSRNNDWGLARHQITGAADNRSNGGARIEECAGAHHATCHGCGGPPPTIIGHATAPITAPVTAQSTTGTAVPMVGEVCAAAGVGSTGVAHSAADTIAQPQSPDLIGSFPAI